MPPAEARRVGPLRSVSRETGDGVFHVERSSRKPVDTAPGSHHIANPCWDPYQPNSSPSWKHSTAGTASGIARLSMALPESTSC